MTRLCAAPWEPPSRIKASVHVWSKNARWHFSDEDEYSRNTTVDMVRVLEFFRDRPTEEPGRSLEDLLGPPEAQEEGWQRHALVGRLPVNELHEGKVRG